MKFSKGQIPSSDRGKKEPLIVRQTEDWLPWEQLCWKGPEYGGGQ